MRGLALQVGARVAMLARDQPAGMHAEHRLDGRKHLIGLSVVCNNNRSPWRAMIAPGHELKCQTTDPTLVALKSSVTTAITPGSWGLIPRGSSHCSVETCEEVCSAA